MAEPVDDAMLTAWLDGELDERQAARIADAVAADPVLAAQAERHRRLKARLAAAFAPLAEAPTAASPPVSATIHSLVDARAKRSTPPPEKRRPIRWTMPGAIAASLVVGVLAGHLLSPQQGVGDDRGALTLSRPIAAALDRQLSGDAGAVRVALSFRDQQGNLCRSFTARHLAGVACRAGQGWQLRYGAPAQAQGTDYRMAGGTEDAMRFVELVIAGDPFDRRQEEAARAQSWRRN